MAGVYRRAAISAFSAVLAILFTSRVARADVADYLGKQVLAVHLQNEGRDVNEPVLLDVVETRVGAPLSMMDVRASVTRLFSFGRFEDVRVHATAMAAGVSVLYDLVPIHPVDRVAFTGADAPGLDAGQLRRAVLDRGGATPPVGRAADLARIVSDQLRGRGYLHAVVTPHAEVFHSPDRATLVFAIEPGVRTQIGGIKVTGNPGVPEADLLKRLRIMVGGAYERATIDDRLDGFLEDRRSHGYLTATLRVDAALTDGDRNVNLTVQADEGPRVRVVFKGDAVPSDKRDDLVPLAREGSADEDLLEDSTNRIRDFFRAQGYRDASAPFTREDKDGELLITFTVRKGPLYRVSGVEIEGNAAVTTAELQTGAHLHAGDVFSDAKLDSDVDAIGGLYRRQGFANAHVQSAVDPVKSAATPDVIPVTVRIAVNENMRTVVGSVRIQTSEASSGDSLRTALAVQPGRPFIPAQLAADRATIEQYYLDRGYQTVTVDAAPGLSADGTRADVVYSITEGPRIRVDRVLIVGNLRTKTSTIVRELQIKPGDPLGVSNVNEAQRRLTELGLFRRTRITEIAHGDPDKRDLLVTVDEAQPTTIGYGGGVEAGEYLITESDSPVSVQHLEFAPRAFFEVGRRNLFGGTRSVNLFARLSLRPKGGSTSETGTTSSGGYDFSEYRVLGTFREPRVFGTSADGSVTAITEQQRRASFNFARRAFTAEVGRRVSRRISVSGNYQIQRTDLFDVRIAPSDKLLVDRLFPQVLLSSFSTAVIADTRDDTLNPSEGRNLSASVQTAGRHIGSEVGLIKGYYTAQFFRTLPHSRGTVLATSARVGTATGFARTARDDQGNVITISDLPASERFFAGGDTTVRGFALDQLGTSKTIDADGFPIGGNGLVILNAELRAPVRGNLGIVGFVDTGNVFARTSDIDLGELRTAVGFGVRYRSPVGPIRVDIGFKVDRHDVVPGRPESLTALHISLGQAF